MTDPAAQQGRSKSSLWLSRWLQAVAGILLGTVFLALMWRSVDMSAVGALMTGAARLPVLIGLAAYTAAFLLRAVRFWLLLDGRARKFPVKPTIAPYIASFGISDILPLRLGDAFRVFWFHRNLSLPIGTVLGAMIVERLLDLVSILLLASVTVLAIGGAEGATIIAELRFVFVVGAAAVVLVLASPSMLDKLAPFLARAKGKLLPRIAGGLTSIADSIRSTGSGRRTGGLILFSLGIWLLESVVMLGAWTSLGGSMADVLTPLLAFTTSTLGTLVPALPGHFGSYEYFGLLSFDAMGVERTLAVAVILLAHLMLWLPTALFCVGWLLLARKGEQFSFRTAL